MHPLARALGLSSSAHRGRYRRGTLCWGSLCLGDTFLLASLFFRPMRPSSAFVRSNLGVVAPFRDPSPTLVRFAHSRRTRSTITVTYISITGSRSRTALYLGLALFPVSCSDSDCRIDGYINDVSLTPPCTSIGLSGNQAYILWFSMPPSSMHQWVVPVLP